MGTWPVPSTRRRSTKKNCCRCGLDFYSYNSIKKRYKKNIPSKCIKFKLMCNQCFGGSPRIRSSPWAGVRDRKELPCREVMLLLGLCREILPRATPASSSCLFTPPALGTGDILWLPAPCCPWEPWNLSIKLQINSDNPLKLVFKY